jgi:hypothetical protein
VVVKGKRFPIRLLALLLPACTVNTPVAEGNNEISDDRLGAGLEPWCEAYCARTAQCPPDYAEQDGCTQDCYETFTESFIAKGDVCAAGALRLMDCAERTLCGLGVCDAQTEANRCSDLSGQVECQPLDGDEGGSSPAGTSTLCLVEYDECSNERIYQVSCAGSPRECECLVDGYTTGRFRYDDADCPQPFEARQICGWPIVPLRDEPPTPPVVSCKLGSAGGAPPPPGGGSVADCGSSSMTIFTEACSDGIEYGIECESSTAGTCTCRFDGEAVGPVVPSDTICPYAASDPDYGAAAMNHACGFSVRPSNTR